MPSLSRIVFALTIGTLRCLQAQAPAPCLTRPAAERTYTRARLLEIVASQTPVRAAYLIRACGVRVPLDATLEADLREAGAVEPVVEAVRAIAPKTATQKTVDAPDLHPPAKGDTRTNPKDGLRYAYIPPGTFRMGCTTEPCHSTEKPAHDVRITRGFWIGQTNVTVEAYKKFIRASAQSMPDEPMLLDKRLNPNWNAESAPITMASWNHARDYCEWSGLRLPTEAEWEYAARAGSTALRYGELDEIAWWAGNSGDKRIDPDEMLKSDASTYAHRVAENGNRPHPVAQKRPNAFKLYDMLGNVWQWTSDWYKNTYESDGPETDPQGPLGGQFRVLRGGSFFSEASLISAAYRARTRPPQMRDHANGFRCAGPVLVP